MLPNSVDAHLFDISSNRRTSDSTNSSWLPGNNGPLRSLRDPPSGPLIWFNSALDVECAVVDVGILRETMPEFSKPTSSASY